MAASDPSPYVATPTGTLQGVAAFSWDGSAWQPSGRAGPDVATPTGVLQGVAPFSYDGTAWQPVGRAQPGVATPSGVLDGVAVYTWSGSAWTPTGGTATPSTPSGALRGVAAFAWDGAAWQPSGQAGPSVPTPYGVLAGVAMFEWGGSTWQAGAAVPAGATLDLSFLSGVLDPRITFTRASSATYFDATGTMQTAATNAPRLDYDPVTHAARGLLIEEARTNVVTNSGSLSSFVPIDASVVAAGIVLPDGTSSGGLRLIEDTSSLEHGGDFTFAGAGSTTYTSTIFAKANTRTRVQIGLRGGTTWAGGNTQVVADLLAGTAVVVAGTATASIQNVGSGWYRVGVTATTVASPTGACYTRFSLSNNANQTTYTGDGASSAYVWGSQLEVGAFPTSYVPTLAVTVTRATDVTQITPLGAWFNAAQGALELEYDSNNPGAVTGGLSDGSTANMIYYSQNGGMNCYVASVNKNFLVVPVLPYPAVNKAASCYQPNRFSGAINGGAVLADTTIPAGPFLWTSRLAIGSSPWALDAQLGGHMRRVRYWPRVLSNAELQSVTT